MIRETRPTEKCHLSQHISISQQTNGFLSFQNFRYFFFVSTNTSLLSLLCLVELFCFPFCIKESQTELCYKFDCSIQFYILFGQSVLVRVCFIINIIYNYFQLIRLSGELGWCNSPRSSSLILTQRITVSSLFSDSEYQNDK